MRYFFFKLETKRVDLPLEGEPYGEAKLYWPGGKVVDIISELKQLEYRTVERIGREDDTWELRLIAATIEYLETETDLRDYHLHSFADFTLHLDKKERTLLIALSPRLA